MKSTDSELLEEYRRDASAEAFAELARRHVDWIYCVARRRVRDAHLAEDVTQGTFVVLAQKPPRLKAGQSLSAWLFNVVNFVSLRAVRSEQRRRARETEAAKMRNQSESTESATWESLAPELDQMVSRLTSGDRQAVLLRFYEQQSFAEVAAALGTSEPAARKRISRAIERLRDMFAGQGVTLSSMSLTSVMLAEVTKPAAAGTLRSLAASSAATSLARGAITMMTWAKVKSAVVMAAMIAFVICGVVIVATTAQQQPAQQAGPTSAPTTMPVMAAAQQVAVPQPAPVLDEIMHVKGIVLDPSGKPLAGAKITVPPPANWNDRLNIKPVAEATSGADGRYEIVFHRSNVAPFSTGAGEPGENDWKETKIVGSADGFGLAWSLWDQTDAAGDLILKLAPDDVPIEGRILTSAGAPAPGVRVVVDEVEPLMTRAERQAAYLKDSSFGQAHSLWLPLHSAGRVEPIFTDIDGRFRLTGIGKDRKISVQISGPSIGYKRFQIATRIMEPQTDLVAQGTDEVAKFITYGAKFEYTAEPSQSVEGTVTDAASGQPVGGVVVQSRWFAGPAQGMDPAGMISSVTDTQGHYRLEGFPKGEGNELIALPNGDQPYFVRVAKIPNEPTNLPAMVDIELHKGVWITGKVTDQITGRPIAARVSYTTYLNNPNTSDFPEFHRQGANFGSLEGAQGIHETQPDGSYRIVAAPGPAIVWLWELKGKYRPGQGVDQIPAIKNNASLETLYQQVPHGGSSTTAVKQVEVPANAQSVTADFQLDPGQTVHVSMIDPDGSPVARSVFVRGETAENYMGWNGRSIAGGSFDAVAFYPGETRTFGVLDTSRKLGRVVVVKINEIPDKKLTIQLQPLAEVSGRCIGFDGKPLEAIPIRAIVNGRDIPGFRTEADGKFKIALIPGGEYSLLVDGGPYGGFLIRQHVPAEPGSTQDFGDVRFPTPMP